MNLWTLDPAPRPALQMLPATSRLAVSSSSDVMKLSSASEA